MKLTQGEKEVMEIFRHFNVGANYGIMLDSIMEVSRKYMSLNNITKLSVLLFSLESKNLITIKDSNFMMLTVAGKEYLSAGFDRQEQVCQ